MKRVPNANTALALDKKAMAGVDKYFANSPTLAIAGTNLTPAAIKAVLQSEIDADSALEAARAEVSQLMLLAVASRAKAHDMRQSLRLYILATAGGDAVKMLQDFGMNPKPSKATVETKAQAVVKSKATRAARHTMGSKQKKAVKGQPANAGPATPTKPAA